MWGTVSFEQWPRRTIQRAPVFFDVSLSLSRNSLNLRRIINDPLPLEPPSLPSFSLFLDFRYPSPLLEWLNRARRVQNSSRASDRESVEPRRFFGVIHADRKSTGIDHGFVPFPECRQREKKIGWTSILSLSLSLSLTRRRNFTDWWPSKLMNFI